ncbi:MAG: SufD family Fe-S cluster assembly protein [Erysipelotrichaceae bacterium]
MIRLKKEKESIQLNTEIEQIKVESMVQQIIIVATSFAKSEVILFHEGSKLTIELIVEENANLSLVMVHGSMDCECCLNVHLKANAYLNLGHVDLQDHVLNLKEQIDLDGEYAQVRLTSSCMAKSHHHFDVLMAHHGVYTSGIMNHYAVVYEQGNYRMVADGHIDKGAVGAKSHQSTRVLTMSDKQKSEVIPILTIDENDVEASHAMSLGQIDEMQAYYLQSRGLTRMQAIGLLTVGYFMPIVEVVQNQELQAVLRKIVQEKVGVSDEYN